MWKKLITPVTVLAVAVFFGLAAVGAWVALVVVVMVRMRMGDAVKGSGLPIPVHVLMAVGYTAVTVLLLRYRRRLQRVGAGLCVVCGYDLRASPERCPECGSGAVSRAESG
jgi:hypothetical protein